MDRARGTLRKKSYGTTGLTFKTIFFKNFVMFIDDLLFGTVLVKKLNDLRRQKAVILFCLFYRPKNISKN